MRKVKIITDSCSDLSPDLLEKYNIDYAKMNTVYEGKTTPADLYWTPEEVHALYGVMRDGNRVTTTQVPVEEFDRIFRKYLDEGYDIVYIGCSVKQSGSVNTAQVLSKKLLAEYPDAKIVCVDSLHASMGEGLLAIDAAVYAQNKDKTAEEIGAYATERRKFLRQCVTVHSLDALKRAGRVKASAAFFGNLFGVKPILVTDVDGEQAAFKKVKGRNASLAEIVNMTKEDIVDPEKQVVYLSHSDCAEEEVDYVVDLIKKEIPCIDVHVGYIGPIIGASIGPDAFAIFSFGKQITFKVGE